MLRTPLCDLLGCEVPILLAGMGGVARSELAAAVARAGGYAMLGMVREDPDLIEREVLALREATNRPFAVNVIPSATEPSLLDRQINRCLDLGVRHFTFFWDPMPEVIGRLKPIPVSAKTDTSKAPIGARAQPAGVTKKPPTE